MEINTEVYARLLDLNLALRCSCLAGIRHKNATIARQVKILKGCDTIQSTKFPALSIYFLRALFIDTYGLWQ